MIFDDFRKSAVISLRLLLPAAPGNTQYPAIVGEWHDEQYPQDCGTSAAVNIRAMHYAQEAMVCSLDDVARNGWKVLEWSEK